MVTSTEIEKMADMENEYWWHIGKRHLVKALVERHFGDKRNLSILDVGCGTGALARALTEFGAVTGFDVSSDAIAFCKSKGLGNVFVQDVSKLEEKQYARKFNLILALDVLEHVQDDVLVMQKIRKMLTDDGLFFVNVPAHKFLWSEHDEALEHKRRYHRVELTKKLSDAGFEIVSNSYFVTVISPLIILYRMWGNIFGKSAYPKTSYVLLPKKLNDFFVALLKIETRILLKTHIPFGVTLNVVARKN
ncbi:TPA: class I SAM-dependent methyltransferase [candidate division WWE3 bacterium]|uniref:Class I SAM-dependent methyltransferase n=1 Tax=candidate division WWE3 bacterium TaxID=2053526 RepID=A0A656PQI6_UNCKA|nr:methyltransferase type 11 [candidate division WWE3 bacterium RAAC2_WWE3_1]KKS29748.1 MAG: Methyltransferase type 11 [candidate division WWE3 bacterium GW2011_GWB1_42_117]KKS55558.1 MAG: Methyltransferase type 11 [candidate division WWE3 bacterium GW2011_GWD2_42_34]KKT06043.1 MAG: Methyltransferase type 11 [candidate division WWE3 bacterium GW2011_GWE2_43_18]KKT06961.1 MAG: Methyltransferase type 11 [candidate division WWE3 bacterium GW2011_GWF2_43_18]KKT08768.1 MAG: Methyltransferase type 1